jgi:SAM-dependent methyltransferase
MSLSARLLPFQTQFIRPLAIAADESDWVPSPLATALGRIDGTCRIKPKDSSASATTSPSIRVRHPIMSRLYVGQAKKADKLGLAERRRQLLSSLSGRVVEIGAGAGTNFAYYPTTVENVVAFEPEPHLRKIAERAAEDAPVPIQVLDAPAEQLPVEDQSLDAAVASLVLCSVADPEKAIAELYRAIRPGGRLLFNEHVRSTSPRVARIQMTADRLGWPHVSGGCHLGRDTTALMRAAGFEIRSLERYNFRIPPLDPPKPHVVGIAHRPGEAAGGTRGPDD